MSETAVKDTQYEQGDLVKPSGDEGCAFVLVDADGSPESGRLMKEEEDQLLGELKEEDGLSGEMMVDEKEAEEDSPEEFQQGDLNLPEEEEYQEIGEVYYEKVDEEIEDGDSNVMSMNTSNIQELVNQALESKLGSFEAQMQKMMAAIQNASTAPVKSEREEVVEADGDVQKEDEERMDDYHEVDVDPDKPSRSKGAVTEIKEKVDKIPPPENEGNQEWKEFLGKIFTILDMVPEAEEKSVLDDAVKIILKTSVDRLPAEGIVKKSWQKVKDQGLADFIAMTRDKHEHYSWPSEDMISFGRTFKTNADVLDYIAQIQGKSRQRNLLPENMSRIKLDIQAMEHVFRYQQRIISYASYFLAGLGKVAKGEETSREETVDEILSHLGQCLIAISDTSVRGCVFGTRALRRTHLDAMKITNKFACTEVVNKPLSAELFSVDYKSILGKFGYQLQSGKIEAGRGQERMRGVGGRHDFRQGGAGGRQNATQGGVQGRRIVGKSPLPAGGRGRGRTSGYGGPRSAQGGREAFDGNRRNTNWGNSIRGNRHNDGSTLGRGRRMSSGDSRRFSNDSGGQGKKPQSDGASGRNDKRRKGNNPTSPVRSLSTQDRYEPRQSSISSIYPPSGMGFPSMDYSRLSEDRAGPTGGSESNPMFGSFSGGILGNSKPSPFPSSSSLGGGYSNPGDSPYLGYMSFMDDDRTTFPSQEGFHGSDDDSSIY